MRIPIPCSDVQCYLEHYEDFLPDKPVCLNDPSHRPYWNSHWYRGLCLDHISETKIPMFNAYCEKCRETISYWPEFLLPYQREPLETHEQVVVEHLQGISLRESANRIGYDPRTLSRWLKLILFQALELVDKVIQRILRLGSQENLPLTATAAMEAANLLLAWVRSYAGLIGFTRLHRLMGLCNMLGKGDWDLWGGPLGNAKSRVKEVPSPG